MAQGTDVVCTYRGKGSSRDKTGANANQVGAYGFVQSGSQTTWATTVGDVQRGQISDTVYRHPTVR